MIWTCRGRNAHFMHASNALNASPQEQASGRASSAEAESKDLDLQGAQHSVPAASNAVHISARLQPAGELIDQGALRGV